MSLLRISEVENGPKAIGPYSLAVIGEGKFMHVSGQIPFDPVVGAVVRGTIAEQTELVLKNLKTIIEAGGASLANVVSCRVYLQTFDAETFKAMNEVYSKYFGEHKPARATVGCQLLNFDVEIEAVVAF